MAKVWFCRDGNRPTDGGPRAVLPLADCVRILDVHKASYLGDHAKVPKFGRADDPLASVRGYQHVVIEVDKAEAATLKWKPGFYRASLTPQKAAKLLPKKM